MNTRKRGNVMYTSLSGEIITKNEERGARSSHVRVSVTSGIANSFVVLGKDIHVNFAVKKLILLISYVSTKYIFIEADVVKGDNSIHQLVFSFLSLFI